MRLSLWLVAAVGCTSRPPAISIDPPEPTSLDDLVVLPPPPEGEVWTWSWRRDGQPVPDLPGDRVPAERTARGERWEVTVQRRGGKPSGEATAEVEIGNAPPALSLSLIPDPPVAAVPLRAAAEASDPDGDPIELSYAWTVDGAPADVLGAVVPAERVQGDQRWEVLVTASDGTDETSAAASATTGNTAPRLLSARIEPLLPSTDDPLTVVYTAADDDGDPVTVEIQWLVGDLPVQTGPELSPDFTRRGDGIRAVVTPTDGASTGLPAETAEVVVSNAPPSASGASVTPAALAEDLVASCLLSDPEDPDGDPVDATVRWFVEAAFVWSGPVLTGSAFSKGQAIQCEATPTDGELSGSAVMSLPVPVLNTPPVIGSVLLVPETPSAAGPVTAVPGSVTDADGDPLDTRVDWYVDGSFAGSGAELTDLVRGEVIEARMEAWDGQDGSVRVRSAAVVVGNAPPTVPRAAMIPPMPTSSDDVTADVVLLDPDGDPTTASITWLADDTAVHTGPILPAGTVPRGARLAFEVLPADDTESGEPVRSPEVVVGNGAPSVTSASVAPAPLSASDTASCTALGASDPDGDPVSFEVLWWIDGVDAGTDPTLTGFSTGDVVRCQLVPTDGLAVGAPVWSAPVVVQ